MSSHSYNKVWLHLIWGTHGHKKIITKSTQPQIAQKFFDIAKEKQFLLCSCHVHNNHVHTLLDLPTNLSIEQASKFLKGISSHWINLEKVLNQKFQWGRGYGVFSVSESNVDKVVRYIQDQDEHHRRKSFREEVKEFLVAYNIEFSDDWLLD